jgi:hypothetical protein
VPCSFTSTLTHSVKQASDLPPVYEDRDGDFRATESQKK